VILLLALLVAGSAAIAAEPTGFEAAKFGMSLEDVWRLYPAAQLLGEKETLGAAVLDGPYIERLALRNQPVPGFPKPTTVELRFWKGRLWGVIVFFGDNDPEACKAHLARVYGPTTSRDPNMPLWRGDTVTTTGTYKQGWYGYTDNALSQEVSAWLAEALKGSWKGATADEKAERERRMAAVTPQAQKAAAAPATPAAPR
jgi:hypothetical protein